MTALFAKRAYLELQWLEHVRIQITNGQVANWESSTTPKQQDECVDVVIPGIPNAHSHVFQRALSGHCEQKSPSDRDDFWSWRNRMYQLAERITPTALKSIAKQAYAEMLAAGYTSVAEFHYLHHSKAKLRSSGEMFTAIFEAAEDVGIRVTYVPILYERAGFGQTSLNSVQKLFALNYDNYVDHYQHIRELAESRLSVALGLHSLRAVSENSIQRIAELAKSENSPIHIHIAEQIGEVEDCVTAHGTTPLRWLFDNVEIDENWCLVHATHADANELADVASTEAVICLCPTTEANLGDGLFSMNEWKFQNGHVAIGSDSQISINPFEELRWLEYGNRLTHRSRNICSQIPESHTGEILFRGVVEGGNRACGHGEKPLAQGSKADLITLKEDGPILAGHRQESLLDALVFSGIHPGIDRVMVDGKWVVHEGEHVSSSDTAREYAACVNRLWN